MLGADVRTWTDCAAKYISSGLVIYGSLFLVAPLILVKGWQVDRQPTFLVLLGLAMIAAGLWNVFRGSGLVIVVVLALLRWRYDLSELSTRSSGWRGDTAGGPEEPGAVSFASHAGIRVVRGGIALSIATTHIELEGIPR